MIPIGLRHPSLSYIQDSFNTADFINNLILYMPLGIALSDSSLMRAFFFGLGLSTCAEALQLGYVDRIPSFLDIASNTMGSVAGYLAARLLLGKAQRPRSLRIPRPVAVAAIPIAILGTLMLLHPRPPSDFSNWNPTFHLAVGNELTGNRPWYGTISEFAIYPFALSPSQLSDVERLGSSSNAASNPPFEAPIVTMRPRDLPAEAGRSLLSRQEEMSLYDTLVSRQQLTIVVWMRTNNLEQSGPGRIITYSRDPFSRNFTLGQIRDTLTFRLRTPASGSNGAEPALYSGPVLSLNHTSFVAASYDGRISRLYVDGKYVAHADLEAKRPRLPRRILSRLPGSLPIRVIELAGAEILLSGLFSIGIFGLLGVSRRTSRRYLMGAGAGAAIGAIVCVFAVSQPTLGFRILFECVAAGMVISASVETETADGEEQGLDS